MSVFARLSLGVAMVWAGVRGERAEARPAGAIRLVFGTGLPTARSERRADAPSTVRGFTLSTSMPSPRSEVLPDAPWRPPGDLVVRRPQGLVRVLWSKRVGM